MVIRRLLLFAAVLLAPVAAPAQPVAYMLEKVVASDEPVPGGSGWIYYSFWSFDLHDDGRVAVSAFTQPTGRGAVAVYDDGPGQLVARSGDPVPGFPGESLGHVGFPFFGGSALAWEGGWGVEPWVGSGLFVREGGVDTARVLPGQTVPGGGSFAAVEQVAMNDAKDVLFYAELGALMSGQLGIFLSRPGGLEQVARDGDPVPPPVGGTFTNVALRIASLADDGSVAFLSEIAGGSVPSALFLRAPDGSLSTLLRQGDSMPTPGGGTVESLGYQVAMNDSHQIAFIAYVQRSGEDYPHAGLYVIDGAQYREVIREGDSLPGTGGAQLQSFAGHPAFAIDAQGDVAFAAWTTSLRKGLFAMRGQTLVPVAFEQQQAPGMPGQRFRDFNQVKINAGGQIGIAAFTTSEEGVFVATPYTPEVPLAAPWALLVLGAALALGARRVLR